MLSDLLASGPPLDAVAFSNDDMAVGGFFCCLDKGIKPKEELALFGFNGLDIGQALPLPLSTIQSPRFEIGKSIVEMLLESRKRPQDKTVVDTGYTIIEGATA
jgi:LacI family gluconate utilization system Gnt-I transcriptional repressor